MLQIPTPPVPPSLPDAVIVGGGTQLESPAIVMIVLAVLVATTLVLWPLVRALARRLEGKGAAGAALQAEVEELRSRVHELEANQGRLFELEERLDFTERILTQKEPARLPDGR
jgi:hypothetical protein